MSKLYYSVVQKSTTLETDKGPLTANYTTLVDLLVSTKAMANVGDRVRVISGKKIPIGTEAVVLKVNTNKYSQNVEKNPSILLQLSDGTEVWTTGTNLISLMIPSVSGIKEFQNIAEAVSFSKGVKNDSIWFFDKDGNLSHSIGASVNKTYKIVDRKTLVSGEKIFLINDTRVNDYCVLKLKTTDSYFEGNGELQMFSESEPIKAREAFVALM